jgi:1-acyl-sn-glycerol-3-phosphate acyltransferase
MWRFPGTIVVEFLPAMPPGLPRGEFRTRIEAAIENASRRLIAEAAASPNPPPLARAATEMV